MILYLLRKIFFLSDDIFVLFTKRIMTQVTQLKVGGCLLLYKFLCHGKYAVLPDYCYLTIFFFNSCLAVPLVAPSNSVQQTLWNKLPRNMRDNGNLVQFKKELKTFLFSTYPVLHNGHYILA